ncbi:metallo-beta-lactamase domain-containing protein 1 [Candidatus Magnetobacterium bavaricum]|uniref:Metallo-beta-lactamase domain-containing protein 1 n=1 Tax=Candidatus Magnetobacterium bavaricum TaxID=29290 RepID=A0A0F3GR74_9BACT|nr:metallo-beta-lactamase domain-containing protein 1 [Candidatus Magnetobacterium bavaricum]
MDESLWRRSSEDPTVQYQSRQRVLQVADYIVPGHGPMFAVAGPARGPAPLTPILPCFLRGYV